MRPVRCARRPEDYEGGHEKTTDTQSKMAAQMAISPLLTGDG